MIVKNCNGERNEEWYKGKSCREIICYLNLHRNVFWQMKPKVLCSTGLCAWILSMGLLKVFSISIKILAIESSTEISRQAIFCWIATWIQKYQTLGLLESLKETRLQTRQRKWLEHSKYHIFLLYAFYNYDIMYLPRQVSFFSSFF